MCLGNGGGGESDWGFTSCDAASDTCACSEGYNAGRGRRIHPGTSKCLDCGAKCDDAGTYGVGNERYETTECQGVNVNTDRVCTACTTAQCVGGGYKKSCENKCERRTD